LLAFDRRLGVVIFALLAPLQIRGRVIASNSFNCVVSDIHMPGMSGLDLMKHLAAQGTTTPVVLITARSDANLAAKAATAGAACLLIKPFEINELIECIEGAVND
jgi:FixJ family two-component response regulator